MSLSQLHKSQFVLTYLKIPNFDYFVMILLFVVCEREEGVESQSSTKP